MPSNTKHKILIVDDDAMISDMYVTKFREEGFDATTAADGKTALKIIKETKPDVVLLDIVMPHMDGFDVLRELSKDRSENQKMKIILLTNLGQKEDVEKGLTLGADDYIIKANFTPSEVVDKVKQYLDL